jgi:uncharacterized protein
MEKALQYVAERLVDAPDEVRVTRVERDRSVVFEIAVAADDTGKVIGKQGRVANALRQVVKAAATKTRMRASVEILSD